MTLIGIPTCGEIGVEMYPDTDKLSAWRPASRLPLWAIAEKNLGFQRRLGTGDAVFVPCSTWYNVLNTGNCPL